MKSTTWFDLSLPGSTWRRGQLRWMMQDLAGVARQPEHDPRTHVRATLEWLCRAQDACDSEQDNGRASAGWTFESGWQPNCIDTTGWLVETLLPAARYLTWPALEIRARTMLEALKIHSGEPSAGQIHGLIAGYVQFGDAGYLEQAVRQAHVLRELPVQPVVHCAQIAYALGTLSVASRDENLARSARQYLDTVLACQTPCGWFAESGVPTSTVALTSTLRSLIEMGVIMGDRRALHAARNAAHALRECMHAEGWLAGAYDDGWMPAASHACLSGLVQMATCWLRLSQLEHNELWRDAAWRALAWIKRNQRTEGEGDPALRDALPNSVPIWRGANAFGFDAMNAKYFADALMMDMVGIAIPPNVRKMEFE